MKQKRLLILGGFPQMIDIVNTAKSMGLYTIVVDRDPKSPAKCFADLALDVSTNDIEALEQICKDLEVDGVFTGFEDFNIHIACKLCARLDLPFYADRDQLSIVTNKLLFKDFCRLYSVPTVEQYTIEEAILENRYPYIVKPADSYGSRGILICHNERELLESYKNAVEISPCGSVIIERFIDYDHGVELFYTVVGGNIHLTATADRYTVRTNETAVPLPVAEVFPSKHRSDILERLDQSIRNMISALRVRDGLILIQALYDGENDYFVYEMAYRLTGEQHYLLIERRQGVSLSRMMIKAAIGEDISSYDGSLLDETSSEKPAMNLAMILSEGKIKEIRGLDAMNFTDEIVSVILARSVGDTIESKGDYSRIFSRVNIVAENYERLSEIVSTIDTIVSVRSINGADMRLSHFLLPSEE